ncbi:PDZ domain-containing protein [Stieleria sp. JC731]|uniref:PDZ domain-containing protein n=1 Tax=Pirellulaceae TaxID=2691357 RepID=UPI001E2C38EF|nr:PDZ domain-containing protein [Stieleria sp. JC731]MCC9602420.1 PDZ domain-containing protein [Stieleria sp. JC731]
MKQLCISRFIQLAIATCLAIVATPAHGQTPQQRQQMAMAIRNAAQQVLPSVVSIEVIGVAETTGRSESSEVSNDAPSCGLIVDSSGFVIASDIILRRPSASLLVVLPDQTRLASKVVARDQHRGLVLLQVNTDQKLPAIELPSEVSTPVGSTVVAVGRYGTDQSPMVSSGILSASGRLEGTMLQTDARVSPTYYGGPLVDLYGNAIGLVVPAVAPGGAPDDTSWYDSGIAFAVPTPVVAEKLKRLRNGSDIKKGLIGIVPRSKDPLEQDTELAAVRTRSPAEKAGLKAGDTILSVAKQPVSMFQQVKQALGPYDAGDEIEIQYRRGDETKSVRVTLAETIPPLSPQYIGVWAIERETGEGDEASTSVAVAGVLPESPSDGKLTSGDVIERMNDAEIDSLATLRRKLVTAEPDTDIAFQISRNGESQQVTVTPTSIAGDLTDANLLEWSEASGETDPWDTKELRLPDVPNLGAYAAPEPDENIDGLALLVLLLPPDQRDPKTALEAYRKSATQNGVVVLAICSEDEQRWQPTEIDVVSRMTTMMGQRVPVAATAIASTAATADGKPTAADSMVIAMALSDRKNFDGIAVSDQARPPAVRLRENEPDRSLQILMPIKSLDDGPTWLSPLSKSGYPITLGGELGIDDLLRWARLLQTI